MLDKHQNTFTPQFVLGDKGSGTYCRVSESEVIFSLATVCVFGWWWEGGGEGG